MSLLVQKYGGTSVGTPERIRQVAKRISEAYFNGNNLVVVVSAMGQTTDELLELAHQVSEHPPHREVDMLLTAGERISMALLSMALADLKVPAISLTGSQTGIITDGGHRRARIKRILGDRVRSAISERKVVIVAGFQGVSETKEITTLGRGGSDTTAVALAAVLKAGGCEIYTDVDGVYSADPRLVPSAKLWKTLPSDLLVELTTLGAGVLHPRSVELAKQFQVPLWVKNSLNEKEGTFVSLTRDLTRDITKDINRGMEEFSVLGVTSDQDQFLVTVELKNPKGLASVWSAAKEAHLSLISAGFSQKEIHFYSDRENISEWRRILEHLRGEKLLEKFEFKLEITPVSVVGDRFSDAAALCEMIQVLTDGKIPVHYGNSSALSATLGVPTDRAKEAVKALHEKLFFNEATQKPEGKL